MRRGSTKYCSDSPILKGSISRCKCGCAEYWWPCCRHMLRMPTTGSFWPTPRRSAGDHSASTSWQTLVS